MAKVHGSRQATMRGSLSDGAGGRLSSGQHRLRRLEVGGGGVMVAVLHIGSGNDGAYSSDA